MKQKLLIITLFIMISAHSQWTEQNTTFSTASRGLNYISIVDADVVWASAYDGSGDQNACRDYTKTTDGGNTWTSGSVSSTSNLSISSISGIDQYYAWAILFPASGTGGGVFHTTNGGITWSQQSSASYNQTGAFPNVVHFWDGNNGFCQGDPVGGYFEIYTTSDGGTTWVRVPSANIPTPISGEYGYVNQVFTAGNRVWFTTNKGRIFRSDDQGLNWEAFQSPLTDFGSATSSGEISFWNNSNGMLIDNNGSLWSTTDGGESWFDVYIDSGEVFGSDISCVPGTTNTVVSSGASHIDDTIRGSSYSTNGGIDWLPLGNNNQVDVTFKDVNTGWAAGFNTDASTGGIFKYTGSELAAAATNDNTITTFKAYPNPVKDILTIEGVDTITNITVFNMLGQKVLNVNPNNSNATINMSSLNNGTYFAKVTINSATETMKIIK